MTRPTPAALAFARSTLPVRRVASTGAVAPGFASLLKAATSASASASASTSAAARKPGRQMAAGPQLAAAGRQLAAAGPQLAAAGPQLAAGAFDSAAPVYHAAMISAGGPAPITRSEMLNTA